MKNQYIKKNLIHSGIIALIVLLFISVNSMSVIAGRSNPGFDNVIHKNPNIRAAHMLSPTGRTIGGPAMIKGGNEEKIFCNRSTKVFRIAVTIQNLDGQDLLFGVLSDRAKPAVASGKTKTAIFDLDPDGIIGVQTADGGEINAMWRVDFITNGVF